MMTAKRLSAATLIMVGLLVQMVFSQSVLRVSKIDPDAEFTTIQGAVNEAKAGYIIEIIDTETYDEQVTIDSTKTGLTLRSSNPKSRIKPVIKWQDVTNRSPITPAEAQNPALSGQFEQCGALRIIRAEKVTIDGIVVDGGGAAPFAYPGVWCADKNGSPPCWPLFHGNAAIAVVVSVGAVIKNCDLRNAYFGIAVKDRNTGGIFANRNPSDNDTTVPLAKFGTTGNHLFEHNRIHNNSVGVYFESSWDLGSTVRYNLIFNNFHQPGTALPATIAPDDVAAGAISFKDNFLSPVAIYNNTLNNNNMNIIGNWQIGAQHLLFNNIFGRTSSFPNDPAIGDRSIQHKFPYRMHNSVFAAQRQLEAGERYIGGCADPSQGIYGQEIRGITQVQMGNGMPDPNTAMTTVSCNAPLAATVTTNNFIPHGALLTGTVWPASANIRWLETTSRTGIMGIEDLFDSTDPADDAPFLRPKWSHPLVQQFISKQGWGAVAPGSAPVDLGARQSSSQSSTVARITPVSVVRVSGTTAAASFRLSVEGGVFNNPQIKLIRWVSPIPNNTNETGQAAKIVPQSSIVSGITVSGGTAVNEGINNINVSGIPPISAGTGTEYGFFEIVLEGEDAYGNKIISDVGFLPFRTLEHLLKIEVLNAAGTEVLSKVRNAAGDVISDIGVMVGEPVKLRLIPVKIDNGFETSFTEGPLKEIELMLSSDAAARMWNVSDDKEFTKTFNHFESMVYNIYFKRAANELISGAGIYEGGGQYLPFPGMVEITVRPGPAAKIAFVDPIPRSQLSDLGRTPSITPGSDFSVVVEVRDRFDNPVNTPAAVNISVTGFSTAERNVGTVGPSSATSDTTGKAVFTANVDK
ncbi:MAG: hypothetical protein LBI42_03125, partial [Chitinispirillales bacterium]|nr:hypothetical protein [Chitinispirillales bacterium]